MKLLISVISLCYLSLVIGKRKFEVHPKRIIDLVYGAWSIMTTSPESSDHELVFHIIQDKQYLKNLLESDKMVKKEEVEALALVPGAADKIKRWLHGIKGIVITNESGSKITTTATIGTWNSVLNTTFFEWEEKSNPSADSTQRRIVRACETVDLPDGEVYDNVADISGTVQFPWSAFAKHRNREDGAKTRVVISPGETFLVKSGIKPAATRGKANGDKELDPAEEEAVDPAEEKAVDPAEEKAVDPAEEAVDPAEEAVDPAEEEAVDPAEEKAVDPAEEEAVDPAEEEAVDPAAGMDITLAEMTAGEEEEEEVPLYEPPLPGHEDDYDDEEGYVD